VTYRARGNEPGWLVEVGPGTSLTYLADYGQERHEFDGITRGGEDSAGTIVFSGGSGTETIRLALRPETCYDDMSGEEFDHQAVVEFAGKELRGCGTALQ
jgi:putative lipoprotein